MWSRNLSNWYDHIRISTQGLVRKRTNQEEIHRMPMNSLNWRGRQCDSPDTCIHWRHWRQTSSSPVNINAVTLPPFPISTHLKTGSPSSSIVAEWTRGKHLVDRLNSWSNQSVHVGVQSSSLDNQEFPSEVFMNVSHNYKLGLDLIVPKACRWRCRILHRYRQAIDTIRSTGAHFTLTVLYHSRTNTSL